MSQGSATALAERCRGRWPDILRSLGLLSFAALAGRDQPCPACGGRDRFRFTDQGFGRWFCRGCGHGGDGLRLIQTIRRVGFPEAAALVETVVGKVDSGRRSDPPDACSNTDKGKPKDPLKPYREAGPYLAGSPVDRYFRARALVITEIEARSLRYAPSLFHWPSKSRWPAVVAQIRLHDGTPLGSHQTFVKQDGSGKAPIERPRLFAAGGKTIGGGVWFGKADPERELVIAEGIESSLSGMRLSGVEAGCAALSELGIRKLILPPEARRIRIWADHDAAGQGIAAAREAARAWKAEGREVAVSISPTVGLDANDILMGRQK
jgi:putative DNA primase/helicase